MQRSPKHRTKRLAGIDLQLTPMIDVVFLLLVFFVFTLTPLDVMARLDTMHGKDGGGSVTTMRIGVDRDRFTMDTRPVSLDRMDYVLGKIAANNTQYTVFVVCSRDSRHADLISVLDLCSQHGFRNIAVQSR